jgi:hypothetical protein
MCLSRCLDGDCCMLVGSILNRRSDKVSRNEMETGRCRDASTVFDAATPSAQLKAGKPWPAPPHPKSLEM